MNINTLIKFKRPSKQTQQTALTPGDTAQERLTISLLTFAEFDRGRRLLESLLPWLTENVSKLKIKPTIIVRNNNPALDSTDFDSFWHRAIADNPLIRFMLFNDGVNLGFGEGHNQNFLCEPSEFFLILNDDIAFSHFTWLEDCLRIMAADSGIGAIGAENSPSSLTPFYGNGSMDFGGLRWPLKYAEGSILFLRSKAFADVGMFDSDYPWAVFEDADLSFRLSSLGFAANCALNNGSGSPQIFSSSNSRRQPRRRVLTHAGGKSDSGLSAPLAKLVNAREKLSARAR
jgi:hypothetical protein